MARRRRSQEEQLARAVGELARTPQGLRLIVVGALIFLVAWGSFTLWRELNPRSAPANPPQPDPPVATTARGRPIRIATWNLRKFSERDAAGQNPPDLVTIARIVKDNRFDLVAIQEVQRQGQMVERLRRQLNEPWRHAVSERTGNNERYAVLYRSDVLELVEKPTLLTGPDAAVFDRVPCRATFRAGAFDFVALTVHLSYTDTARRKREADALARISGDLAAGPEKDILVLGDFNEQRSKPNLGVFNSVGFRTLNTAPTNLGSSEVYDNILLNPNFTREWLGVVDVVRFDETHFANDDKAASSAVSDHRPVWAEFATAGTDDD